MVQHLVRRLLLAIPLVLGVVVATFLLVELAPGSWCDHLCNEEMHPETCAEIRGRSGCDEPAVVRFVTAMGNLLTFEFGTSTAVDRGKPVIGLIATALPNTLLLCAVILVVAQVTGVVVGVVQAVWHRRWPDTLLSVVTLTLYSVPTFWLALVLLIVFTIWVPVLHGSGTMKPSAEYLPAAQRLLDQAKHLILPGVAMGLAGAASDARYMRSSMLEVLHQDFVRTARAKGLSEARVVLVHALRNALLPTITLMGLQLPFLFGGTVVIEQVFSWPGMGRLILAAALSQDAPVLMAVFYFYALVVAAGAILADLLYAIADPRIRFQ